MDNQRRTSFFKLPIIISVLLPLLFCGCGAKDGGKDAKKQERPTLSVATVQRSDATVTTGYAALLEGKVNVEIRPQVDGTLQNIYVDEGAFVKAGQSLFKVEDQLYREQYNSALAAQHAADARLAVAKIDMEKLVPLVKSNVVADIQLKGAKANYQVAQAAAEQAKAALRSASVNLGYTVIKAPVSGYIGKIPFRIGSLVTKNQAGWLTMLSDVSEVYAYFSMSELDYIRFRKQYAGSSMQETLHQVPPVSLLLADGTRFSEKGSLTTVSGQFDQATGSVRVRAVFPNRQGLLRSGNTGTVVMESVYHQALMVPQASTVELQDKVFVFLLDKGNKVRKQAISVAARNTDSYVVSAGLNEGDTFVMVGVDKLQDGAVIRPVRSTPGAGEPRK
ncbi:MAG: efflux RND transporter periplasmic adaptor subunit [Chlorobium sp.]